jgi:hypothetical protein
VGIMPLYNPLMPPSSLKIIVIIVHMPGSFGGPCVLGAGVATVDKEAARDGITRAGAAFARLDADAVDGDKEVTAGDVDVGAFTAVKVKEADNMDSLARTRSNGYVEPGREVI